MKEVDLAVVGGGPAGLAAAVEARQKGLEDIIILEREEELGGILKQCIHNGFGLHIFGEELTGPEYAWKYIDRVNRLGIPYLTDTMVLGISPEKVITAVNSRQGVFSLKAKAIVLAMGCRERTRGALNIPGSRPAGIYTAGTAQRYVNVDGYLPGRKVVILGSGDIGLIMARRLTLEGAEVRMVCELLPYSGGLARNIVQCLNDYNIPLKLSHTVIQIHGKERLEGVTIARVDENRIPIPETAEFVACDTLLLSVGLIPENELSREAGIILDPKTSGPEVNESMETSKEGIFACGNVVQVHDLVDYVTQEAALAGGCAAGYVLRKRAGSANENDNEGREQARAPVARTKPGDGIRYIVPQRIDLSPGNIESKSKSVKLFFRVDNAYENVRIRVACRDAILAELKKRKVSPGEMEHVVVETKMLEGMAEGAVLRIELAKGGQTS